MKDYRKRLEAEILTTSKCRETGIIICLDYYFAKTKSIRKAAFLAESLFGKEEAEIIEQWIKEQGEKCI